LPEEVAAVNATRRFEYAALEAEALERVRSAHNIAQRIYIENQTDAERNTRMTNKNAARRDLRKRRADDVEEEEDETAVAEPVATTSLPSKRRTVHPRGLANVDENVEEQTFETLALEYDAKVSSWRTLRFTCCSAGDYSDVRPTSRDTFLCPSCRQPNGIFYYYFIISF
jgi:hypothetical protein